MPGTFALVALASVIAVAYGWPSEEERTQLLNDLQEWSSMQPEAPTSDKARAYLQMKYMAMKQEQMNQLYNRMSSEIGRPAKGLWRKKRYSLPTLTVHPEHSSSQSSDTPKELSSASIAQLLRPSQAIWKKNADDEDQLMDIWKSGFRFKKSAA